MSDEKIVIRSGSWSNFVCLLQVLLIGLKLGEVIDWSWFMVLMPFLFPFVLAFIFAIFCGIFAILIKIGKAFS